MPKAHYSEHGYKKRTFNGKVYGFDSVHVSKQLFNERVTTLRRSNWLVRTETRKYKNRGVPTQYVIYRRKR